MLHPLEIQAIADGEVATQMQGLDPVANGQTTAEEIARCQADPNARLALSPQAIAPQMFRHKGPRYTPIAAWRGAPRRPPPTPPPGPATPRSTTLPPSVVEGLTLLQSQLRELAPRLQTLPQGPGCCRGP